VYDSLTKLLSLKNSLENLGNKPNDINTNIPKYRPQDFILPAQDLKNLEDFALTYSTDIVNNFGGLHSKLIESESHTEEESDDMDSSNSSAYKSSRCASEVTDF